MKALCRDISSGCYVDLKDGYLVCFNFDLFLYFISVLDLIKFD